MYIYTIFDVEDLVHPESDDIPRDICDMLADNGIVASMCVVGEKARLWERRGRTDVISSVRQHDVGLHTDHHSVHPAVSEYLADKGWADGVAEALQQEEGGARDLARIFGMYPSSWGTSGNSWGPQIPAATRVMGIPSNVYSHARSGADGTCWYAGQLCYPDYLDLPGGETACCDDEVFEQALPVLLKEIETKVRAGTPSYGLFGGHPTRFRYTAFWDSINFNRGQNTDPANYRSAPSRDDAGYASGLRNLLRMILAVREIPGVEMVSVRELNQKMLPNTAFVTWGMMHQLAQSVADSPEILTDNPLASPAQALDLLARAVLRMLDDGPRPDYLPVRMVLGPVSQPPALEHELPIDDGSLMNLCSALACEIGATFHVPAALEVDGSAVGPGAMLRLLARSFLELERGSTGRTVLQPGPEEPAVAADLAQYGIYELLPDWTPHSPDLELDRLALHTRLQSWSLKPALLKA